MQTGSPGRLIAQRQERSAEMAFDPAPAVRSLRLSIRNGLSKGQVQEIAALAGLRPEQLSRQLSADPPEGGQGLHVAALLAAIRFAPPERVEAWKELLFGGVTEIFEERVTVVRFPNQKRRLEGM